MPLAIRSTDLRIRGKSPSPRDSPSTVSAWQRPIWLKCVLHTPAVLHATYDHSRETRAFVAFHRNSSTEQNQRAET